MENLIVMRDLQCPICKQTANMQIAREVDFLSLLIIFNMWFYGKTIATCGFCHQSFEIDSKKVYDFLESSGISVNRSNMKKNLISITIPIIIIYSLTKIL